jgi:hypothetical protein
VNGNVYKGYITDDAHHDSLMLEGTVQDKDIAFVAAPVGELQVASFANLEDTQPCASSLPNAPGDCVHMLAHRAWPALLLCLPR